MRRHRPGEFSRFASNTDATTGGMKEPLQSLRAGMRGFYLGLAGPMTLRCGDLLLVSTSAVEGMRAREGR